MNAPARKTEDRPGPLPPPKPMQTYAHRRFVLPDLNDKGEWIVKRLRNPEEDMPKRYAHSQDREIFNFLRSVIDSPEFLFVRTDHAFILAQLMREPLMHNPVAKEWFVLCLKMDDINKPEEEKAQINPQDEAAYLYSVMFEWAKHSSAEELRIENYTDVPRDMVKARLGKLFAREMIYSKLNG